MSSDNTELFSWHYNIETKITQVKFPVEIVLTMKLLAKKWTLYVLHALENQDLRFNELKKVIDNGKISSNMLSSVLKELLQYSLIEKQLVSISPIRVKYSRTYLANDVSKLCNVLGDFGLKYLAKNVS